MKTKAVAAIVAILFLCTWPITASGRGFPVDVKEGTVCSITSLYTTVKGVVVDIDTRDGWVTLKETESKDTVHVKMDNISFVRVEARDET